MTMQNPTRAEVEEVVAQVRDLAVWLQAYDELAPRLGPIGAYEATEEMARRGELLGVLQEQGQGQNSDQDQQEGGGDGRTGTAGETEHEQDHDHDQNQGGKPEAESASSNVHEPAYTPEPVPCPYGCGADVWVMEHHLLHTRAMFEFRPRSDGECLLDFQRGTYTVLAPALAGKRSKRSRGGPQEGEGPFRYHITSCPAAARVLGFEQSEPRAKRRGEG